MSTGRIIWTCLLAICLAIFFFWIPIDIYDNNTIVLSLLGGFTVFACLFMALGDFQSMYDIFAKPEPGEEESTARKYAPAAVIPAFAISIILIFWHGDRAHKELAQNGILTKGTVVGGQSQTTTRRFRSNTSYDITVVYQDSLKKEHRFSESVSGSEFNDLYEGAVIDVVYSRIHPSLAKAVVSVDELAKYKFIPKENLRIDHLVSILEGKIKRDSILAFLNSINYEWHSIEDGQYLNDKLEIAIQLTNDGLAYVQKTNLVVVQMNRFSFEKDMLEQGFKKKASTVDGETAEVFYNDRYAVSKERKNYTNNSSNTLGFEVLEVFRIVDASLTQ